MKGHRPRKWYEREILRWKTAYRIVVKERNELLKELNRKAIQRGFVKYVALV
jgi:hypothetical protein